MKNIHIVLISFVASWSLVACNLGNSPTFVYDEQIYTHAAKDFVAGIPTTNPTHPPVAKYFIAIGIKTLGDNPWGWRIASTLFGALALSMMLAWVLELTGSRMAAITAAVLLAFNNFWFVMSRVAMLSIFSFALSIVGLYLYTVGKRKSVLWMVASGAALGLAIGCRWSALPILGVVCVLSYKRISQAVFVACSAVLVYVISFVPLLIRQHMSVFSIVDMNAFMWNFHRHEAVSTGGVNEPWYGWVFRSNPVVTLNFLVANPVITIAGLVAIIVLLCYKDFIPVMLVVGSLAMWAASLWACTYYYYYLETFSLLSPVIAIACLRLGRNKRLAFRPEIAICGLALAGFVYHYGAMTTLPVQWDFTLFYFQ